MLRRVVAALLQRAAPLVQGLGLRALADAVGGAFASVARWVREAARGGALPRLGRPPKPLTSESEEAIRGVVRSAVGKVSIRQLRQRFPDASRRSLRMVRSEVRRELRRARRRGLCTVAWTRVGAVWTMDHTQEAGAAALCVRDLASNKVLHVGLAPDVGAAHVAEILQGLFEKCGAPLAFKCDNGSAFIAGGVRALLEERGVLPLYSPARCPEYNGCVESGMRWVKEVAADLAFIHGGAPGDLLREAGLVLNAQLKRGQTKTPDERWVERTPITVAERRRMHRLVAAARRRRSQQQGIAEDAVLAHAPASAVDRYAIPAALKCLGVLHIQRPSLIPEISR